MTAQILDRGLICFRIGDPDGQYPIFDGTGSTIAPGRWNTAGSPMVYASEHYSTGLLEKLVHGSGALPPNQHFITITIPRGLTYEVFSQASMPDWERAGNRQQSIRRSLVSGAAEPCPDRTEHRGAGRKKCVDQPWPSRSPPRHDDAA